MNNRKTDCRMYAGLATALTWQIKSKRVVAELHGCKIWYILQLVDNREEAHLQKQQENLFSINVLPVHSHHTRRV